MLARWRATGLRRAAHHIATVRTTMGTNHTLLARKFYAGQTAFEPIRENYRLLGK